MNARLVRGATATFVLATVLALSGGCLDRPVVAGEPITKTNFTQSVRENTVDKIDLLFSIDNSASMGDKQAYLEQAIPDLIARLINPNCLSATDPTAAPVKSGTDGQGNATCPAGSNLEFPAVHDMHIGIVSSSLGPRLGDTIDGASKTVCQATYSAGTITYHNDDRAHLLSRSSTPGATAFSEGSLPDAASGFLAWFPGVAANAGKSAGASPVVTDATTLEGDFADLVAGVNENG